MRDEPWHMDKRVPVALIITIAFQTIGAGFWLGSLTADFNTLQQAQMETARRVDALTTTQNQQAVSSGRLEQDMAAIKETIGLLREDQRETNQLLRQMMEGKK